MKKENGQARKQKHPLRDEGHLTCLSNGGKYVPSLTSSLFHPEMLKRRNKRFARLKKLIKKYKAK